MHWMLICIRLQNFLREHDQNVLAEYFRNLCDPVRNYHSQYYDYGDYGDYGDWRLWCQVSHFPLEEYAVTIESSRSTVSRWVQAYMWETGDLTPIMDAILYHSSKAKMIEGRANATQAAKPAAIVCSA
jgi:hypothetical protein